MLIFQFLTKHFNCLPPPSQFLKIWKEKKRISQSAPYAPPTPSPVKFIVNSHPYSVVPWVLHNDVSASSYSQGLQNCSFLFVPAKTLTPQFPFLAARLVDLFLKGSWSKCKRFIQEHANWMLFIVWKTSTNHLHLPYPICCQSPQFWHIFNASIYFKLLSLSPNLWIFSRLSIPPYQIPLQLKTEK